MTTGDPANLTFCFFGGGGRGSDSGGGGGGGREDVGGRDGGVKRSRSKLQTSQRIRSVGFINVHISHSQVWGWIWVGVGIGVGIGVVASS